MFILLLKYCTQIIVKVFKETIKEKGQPLVKMYFKGSWEEITAMQMSVEFLFAFITCFILEGKIWYIIIDNERNKYLYANYEYFKAV